ncbi:sugar ABC transporter ATP-binding protein [Verminephrobacter eiseniae]|uniref:sugar ABC transporter ATP-binding protein n=1 Tax=Verminephrobacter eiseniae TaxID=364317 RepID=UPI002238F692|nr:sugar ABC transporter ATP-binding protein [Verminephrobacter eiseniae]MCW5229937.1 sugar ABC transporter ATP-binding protein [Verminephrobacter eiseniae]MCW5291669.1 sugar ABC transporter ATP-binding protein [Verminephrobacter eiseniae]MCW8183442.1 sugar ABC transporter ATP-binding protein [Verminephrobacter eiseniae]MCW8221709.1 sugar ABC transporter ATP-binding protein [Verminephrobacter eiseniae]MCW8233441.1 sugar ABC transporter ATP-binding protein [Verminephrobacter eiseniae]
MPAPQALLAIDALGKDYTATVLDGVTLTLNAGEVLALTGENGAGKSTLAKILCGLTLPTRGHMRLAGQVYAPASRRDAERHGLRMVLQELGLVPTLTVAENLLLGRLPQRAGWLRRAALHSAARAQLDRIGLHHLDPATPVARLGLGQQQMLEIARNLQDDTRILVLDEPTAMLTPRETSFLFEQIAQLTARGVAIVYVSHRLEELRRVADRVAVLRDGRLVDLRPMAGLSEDELVQRMVGHSVSDLEYRPRRAAGPVVLSVEGLGRGSAVQDVSLQLHAGELLGIAGLVGSGRTELLRLLFGADRADRGCITLHPQDRPLPPPIPSAASAASAASATSAASTASAAHDGWPAPVAMQEMAPPAQSPARRQTPRVFSSPLQAIAAGLGLVTEDRKSQGLLLTQPIRINATLSDLGAIARGGWLQRALENRLVQSLVHRLGIRCRNAEQPVGQLSGGNQQKVVFARWLHRPCRVLLLDEPTRGVDVGARAELYRELDRMAAEGRALLMVSSDLRELMSMADRIGVMRAGRLVALFERGQWSEQALLAAAFAHTASNPAPVTR